MLVTKKTFEDILEKYETCSKHPFTLFSGGIGVGKTMYAKMIATMLADSEFSDKFLKDFKSCYRLDYLDAACLIGQVYEKRYKELVDEERIAFLAMHQGYSYDNFVYGIHVQTKDNKLNISKAKHIFIEMVENAAKMKAKNMSSFLMISAVPI